MLPNNKKEVDFYVPKTIIGVWAEKAHLNTSEKEREYEINRITDSVRSIA